MNYFTKVLVSLGRFDDSGRAINTREINIHFNLDFIEEACCS